MAELVVRRLLIDPETSIERHWCAGDAFRSAFFNALSMSFPVGEQFFIDAVRRGLQMLPVEKQGQLSAEVQRFIGQEATHRRIHDLFNGHLEKQGLINEWGPRVQQRAKLLEEVDPRHGLAVTSANEHFTVMLAEWLLRHHDLLDGSEPRLKTMWLWHCAEESEHKSTAFDLYHALDGNHEWRITWFRRITIIFLREVFFQTLGNLKQDGTLWRWRTWKSAGSFLFGGQGLVRSTWKTWREYFRRDFHPSQLQSDLSQRWLETNGANYKVVGAG